MGPFQVIDKTRMRLVLEAFSRLDEIRWQSPTNYNLINYCANDLTPDEQILTHWLCYITDRQMPFMRIWDIGGYVLSYIVREYSRDERDVTEAFTSHMVVVPRSGRAGLLLECPPAGPNRRLQSYGITAGPVRFASRYMPEDLVLILRTLLMLDKVAGRSLARFTASVIADQADHRDAIGRLATALYGLTYSAGGVVSAKQVPRRIRDDAAAIADEAESFVHDANSCIEQWGRGFNRFRKKRLWCALRDYLKSPEFNSQLVAALGGVGVHDADKWNCHEPSLQAAMDALELPGDVWNNNEVFQAGLFSPYLANERPTWNMARTVREIHDILGTEGTGAFYPEQLDVTFDFVPRMCQRQMCHVCLFGNGIEKLCHRNASLLCPVVLTACGYVHTCEPDQCDLKNDLRKGLCQSDFTTD